MKNILSLIIAIFMLLSVAACAKQEPDTVPESTASSTEPSVTEAVPEPTETMPAEPGTFLEAHGVVPYTGNEMTEFGDIYLGTSEEGYRFTLDSSDEPSSQAANVSYFIPITTEKFYGDAMTQNEALDFEIRIGQIVLAAEEELENAASAYWYLFKGWEKSGISDSESNEAIDAYNAYQTEFEERYSGYKIISCVYTVDVGAYTENSLTSSNDIRMGFNHSFAVIDKYSGTTFYPSEFPMAISEAIVVDGTEYDINIQGNISYEYYDSITGDQIYPRITKPEDFFNIGVKATYSIILLVPSDYDGTTFLIGASNQEYEDSLAQLGTNVLSYTQLPQYGQPGNYFFDVAYITQHYTNLRELNEALSVIPDFDATAQTGTPEHMNMLSPIYDFDCKEILWYNPAVSIKDGKADICMTNPADSNLLVYVYAMHQESFQFLGSSGMLRPGEYISDIPMVVQENDGPVTFTFLFYDPDTMYLVLNWEIIVG